MTSSSDPQERRKQLFDTDKWHFHFIEGSYRYICGSKEKYREVSPLLGEKDFLIFGKHHLSAILDMSDSEKVNRVLKLIRPLKMDEEVSILEAHFPEEAMEIPGILAPFYVAIKREELSLIASFTILTSIYFVLPTLEKSKFIDVSLNVLEDLTIQK